MPMRLPPPLASRHALLSNVMKCRRSKHSIIPFCSMPFSHSTQNACIRWAVRCSGAISMPRRHRRWSGHRNAEWNQRRQSGGAFDSEPTTGRGRQSVRPTFARTMCCTHAFNIITTYQRAKICIQKECERRMRADCESETANDDEAHLDLHLHFYVCGTPYSGRGFA